MRKEDNSPQGKIVTELLQHLHACKNNCDVFYGRQSLSPQYLANHGHRHRDNHHDRHLHACKNSCTFFCAREDELEKMKEYITGPSQKVEKVICEDLEYIGNHNKEKEISCK